MANIISHRKCKLKQGDAISYPLRWLELETELADVAEGMGERALPHVRGKEDGTTTVENRWEVS